MLTALILADSRFPGGGHVHSGGLEEAAARGLVHDEPSLRSFLHGRLLTSGLLAAGFAARRHGVRTSPGWTRSWTPARRRPPSARLRGRRGGACCGRLGARGPPPGSATSRETRTSRW